MKYYRELSIMQPHAVLTRLLIKLSIIILLVYNIFLLWTSLSPSMEQPSMFVGIPNIDKMEHFIQYFILACLWFLVLERKQILKWRRAKNGQKNVVLKNSLAYSTAFSFYTGVSIELLQFFSPGRDCDIIDIIADALGILVGISIIWIRRCR